MSCRPALGGAVFGARTEDSDFPRAGQCQGGESFVLLRERRIQFRVRQRERERLLRCFRQLCESLDHSGQAFAVQRVALVEQSITCFARKTDTSRNSSQPGN